MVFFFFIIAAGLAGALMSLIIVHPQEEKLVLQWGKMRKVLKEPGTYVINFIGRKVITISRKHQSMEIHQTTVADANGNPLIVAGVCTFRVLDPVKAGLEVEDYVNYVKTQAVAVLKQVASQYPYESDDGHNLKDEADVVNKQMVERLSEKVEIAGVEVLSFELSDLSYAPEIAQALLVRQQAQALVDARKIVVEGAVEIVDEAIQQLTERGFQFEDSHRTELVGTLLTVICGDAKVQPTYTIQSKD